MSLFSTNNIVFSTYKNLKIQIYNTVILQVQLYVSSIKEGMQVKVA